LLEHERAALVGASEAVKMQTGTAGGSMYWGPGFEDRMLIELDNKGEVGNAGAVDEAEDTLFDAISQPIARLIPGTSDFDFYAQGKRNSSRVGARTEDRDEAGKFSRDSRLWQRRRYVTVKIGGEVINEYSAMSGRIKFAEAYLGTKKLQDGQRKDDRRLGERVIEKYDERGGDCIGEVVSFDDDANLVTLFFDCPPDGGRSFVKVTTTLKLKDAKDEWAENKESIEGEWEKQRDSRKKIVAAEAKKKLARIHAVRSEYEAREVAYSEAREKRRISRNMEETMEIRERRLMKNHDKVVHKVLGKNLPKGAKLYNCGECSGCLTEECMECKYCIDSALEVPTLRKRCGKRICTNKTYLTPNQQKAKKAAERAAVEMKEMSLHVAKNPVKVTIRIGGNLVTDKSKSSQISRQPLKSKPALIADFKDDLINASIRRTFPGVKQTPKGHPKRVFRNGKVLAKQDNGLYMCGFPTEQVSTHTHSHTHTHTHAHAAAAAAPFVRTAVPFAHTCMSILAGPRAEGLLQEGALLHEEGVRGRHPRREGRAEHRLLEPRAVRETRVQQVAHPSLVRGAMQDLLLHPGQVGSRQGLVQLHRGSL